MSYPKYKGLKCETSVMTFEIRSKTIVSQVYLTLASGSLVHFIAMRSRQQDNAIEASQLYCDLATFSDRFRAKSRFIALWCTVQPKCHIRCLLSDRIAQGCYMLHNHNKRRKTRMPNDRNERSRGCVNNGRSHVRFEILCVDDFFPLAILFTIRSTLFVCVCVCVFPVKQFLFVQPITEKSQFVIF